MMKCDGELTLQCRNETYEKIKHNFQDFYGEKNQVYSILDFCIKDPEIGNYKINEALKDIIENDLLYIKADYRVPLLELDARVLTNKWNLEDIEKDFLLFILRLTYSFPGVVGTPVNVLKLKSGEASYQDFLKVRGTIGADGFCSEYMISQMKGGLSLDILVGCPLGCRYCYRIDEYSGENYVNKWNPQIVIEPEEIVERLLKHPWFTPHVSPLGIHMSTTEAFLEQIWPYTIKILDLLDKKGLTNRVSIITKYVLPDEKIDLLGKLTNLSVDICVCYSGMPKNIEPSSDKRRTQFLKKIVLAQQEFPNLHAIAYYRPIIEGYNTTDEKIEETVKLIKESNVEVVVFGGLKHSDLRSKYFMQLALPNPIGDFEEGKKYLSDEVVSKIMSAFEREYGEKMPAILRRSSCARVVARGSKYPDYNAHWTAESKNCSLNCPQKDICAARRRPSVEDVLSLLERIGKSTADYTIDEQVIVWDELSMFEKTFMSQNLYYSVIDKNDVIKFAKKTHNSGYIEVIKENIMRYLSSNEVNEILSLREVEQFEGVLNCLVEYVSNQIVPDYMRLEVQWEVKYMALLQTSLFHGMQLFFATALEMLDELLLDNACGVNVLVQKKMRELLYFLADKGVSICDEREFFCYKMDDYFAFSRSYLKERDGTKSYELKLTAFSLIVKSIESKFKIRRIKEKMEIGIVIPMKNEKKNIMNYEASDSDSSIVDVKMEQLQWLLEGTDVHCELWFVEDIKSDNSTEIVRDMIYRTANIDCEAININDVINGQQSKDINPFINAGEDFDSWAKGGAVCWGMYEFCKLKKDFIIYTDFDLTYPLEQIGNLLFECTKFKTGACIGSRKCNDSWGYYGINGPNKVSKRYGRAINEVYNLKGIKDVQAGFKCFRGNILRNILEEMLDRKLSFDAELIYLCQSDWDVAEVGVVVVHEYVEGKVGTARNYDVMLVDSINNAINHGIIADVDELPFVTKVLNEGGVYSR